MHGNASAGGALGRAPFHRPPRNRCRTL